MEVFIRFTLCVTILVGTFVGVGYSQPPWLADLGMDFWNLPDMQRTLAESCQLSDQLDQVRLEQAEYYKSKEDVLKRVIDAEMSLTAGADEILTLSDENTLRQGFESLNIEGKTQKERVCRMLILWAERNLEHRPDKLATVHTHLQEQLSHFLSEADQELTQE